MRQDDVPHTVRFKPKRFNSTNCRISLIKLKSRHVDERLPQPCDRIENVIKPNTRINQNQPITLLKQQAMTDDRRKRRDLKSSTIEMMNDRHTVTLQTFNVVCVEPLSPISRR